MSDRIYERFSRMIPANHLSKRTCHVIGVGAVGRPLTLMLARAGAKVVAYDDDTVDWPNVGTQGYNAEDVGKPKIQALREEMGRMLPPEKQKYRGYAVRLEEAPAIAEMGDHVFLCVDSMASRKQLSKCKEAVTMYDVRCGSKVGNVQCWRNSIAPSTQQCMSKYAESLFDDEDSSPAPCGLQTMPHVSQFAAALAFNMFCDALTPDRYGIPYRCQVFDLFDGVIDNYDAWPTPSVTEPAGV